MRPLHLCLCLAVVLSCGCDTQQGPEVVAAVDATVACDDPGAAPFWSFGFAASGPVDETETEVEIFTEAVPNDFAYGMSLDGSNGTLRADFSLDIDGTPAGEAAFPGDVPFACEDLGSVSVVFCALDANTRATTCWACEAEPGTPLPEGADDWMPCG